MKIKEITISEWESLWPLCEEDNLLQSWFYGKAKEKSDGVNILYYSFSLDNSNIALAQILIKKIPFLGRVARLNRGPIFLIKQNHHQKIINMDKILRLIVLNCKESKIWMLQAAPEIIPDKKVSESLENSGFYKIQKSSWASGLINLTPDEDTLLMSLNGKWRNCYRKSLKLEVKISRVENSFENINKLIVDYKKHQLSKDFAGLTDKLINEMAFINHKEWKFNIFQAKIESQKESIGSLVTIHHGKTSIYLIGTTNDLGRKYQANYSLIWNALLFAKNSGCQNFDIGGLDETTPKGIAHFKKGLNAESYKLTGEWRKFIFPSFF